MTTSTAATAIDLLGEASMSPARRLRAYLAEARYETIRMLRTPGFTIPFLGLPAVLYLLLGVVIFGAALSGDPQGKAFVFAAFSVFGMAGPGMFGFGTVMALEREQGVLRLKRALPMPPAAYVLAKMLMAVAFAVVVMATMLAAARVAGLRLEPSQALAVAAVNVLGSLPFCAIGLFLGTRTTARSAPAIVNVLYQLMLHLSGIFYALPKALRLLAPIWPTYHLQQIVFRVMGARSEGAASVHATFLVGLTCILTVVSVRRMTRRG